MTNRLERRAHDDRGFAMITALLVVVVAAFLGATAVAIATHDQDASARDRARTQSVHAAEAGIDTTLKTISASSLTTLPCTTSGSTTDSPVATWNVEVDYYVTYPPSGTKLACSALTGVTGTPLGVMMRSTGSVHVTGGYVNRVMQAQARLTAVYGEFNKAVFSEGSPNLVNQLDLHGFEGNDANFYTNGSWSCPNQTTVNGSVTAQGTIAISNSCYIAVDAWANGAVTMSNTATVNHDVISSTASLTMQNNSKVNRDVTVGTSCSGCTTGSGGRVGGRVTTNSAQAAPPRESYPVVNFSESAWLDAGYQVEYFTSCAAARTWLTTAANNGTKKVIRITGGCTLTLSNDTVRRTNDLAIFTDGPISTTSNTLFTSGDGLFHDLFLISQSGTTCTGTTSGSPGTIFMASSTGFSNLHFFLYAPCTVSFANNNSGSRGQIYGNPVSFASNLSYTYYPTVVPGAGSVTGYKPEVGFVREIK